MVRVALIPDDDPGWCAFYAAYPWHAGKLDARKAYRQMGVTMELVEREVLPALAWQMRLWERQGYGMPLPATYLRGRRWEDEPPPLSSTAHRLPAWAATAKGAQS